ncbi:F-box protein At5g03100-like isoform X1 [Jatropha curcas]|uniref:F-box protein At5g03100-like isoform X1 n=1 Tax=Jatropha curcas TaxID=180498 RepID=UPI0018954725|nr:F-box protein At5g03100-like isoform X1 [Jatropha curcas]
MEKPCKLPKIENSTSSDNDINSKTRDFISELPDDVLYSILLKLPLRESVRTRVLSHRWKHVYAFPSILELNWLNMGQNHDFLEENEHPCRNCEEKFVRGVNQYLDFYKGTCLRSFKASFCLGHGPKSDIDRWVNFAIRMGVETLSLDLYCEASSRNPTREMFGEQLERNYVFQSSLLEGAKLNLKNLRLVACRLGRNFTNQFSFLETLTLAYSPLARYDLHTLFSYMVNLNQLILLACSLPVKLSLGSLLLLKKFCLTGGAGTKELELSNPKLLHFQCMTREAITVNLSAVPNLITLKHSVDSTGIRYVFTHVSQNHPMLRTLTVYSRCDWVCE